MAKSKLSKLNNKITNKVAKKAKGGKSGKDSKKDIFTLDVFEDDEPIDVHDGLIVTTYYSEDDAIAAGLKYEEKNPDRKVYVNYGEYELNGNTLGDVHATIPVSDKKAKGGVSGEGWEKQDEWHGNPSLGYESWKKMFALPTGRKVPVYVFGTKENGWSYVVSAGKSSDYSYSGGFPVDVRNEEIDVVLKYADDLYKHGKMIFADGGFVGKPIGSTGMFEEGGEVKPTGEKRIIDGIEYDVMSGAITYQEMKKISGIPMFNEGYSDNEHGYVQSGYDWLRFDLKNLNKKKKNKSGLYGKGGKAKIVQVYSFDELSDEAKEKAITSFSDINVDHEWWDGIYDDAARAGIKIEGFDIYRKEIDGKFTEDATNVADRIKKDHGEETNTYKLAEEFWKDHDRLIDEAPKDDDGELEDERELDEKLDEVEEEFRKQLLEDYLIMLCDEYEYLTSTEAIAGTIRANDYEFLEDGRQPNFAWGGQPIEGAGDVTQPVYEEGGQINKFTYSDSVAGVQHESFKSLSEIIKYIEEFGYYGDSEGVVFESDKPVLEYVNRENGITWRNTSNDEPLHEDGGSVSTVPDFENPESYDDYHQAIDVELYGENNQQLYRSRWIPMLKNLKKKRDKGTFDVEKAAVMLKYWVEDADKRYQKEILERQTSGFLLSVNDRKLLSKKLAHHVAGLHDNDMTFERGGNVVDDGDKRVDEVLNHYVAAALWSSYGSDEDGEGDTPLDANYDKRDIDEATLKGMRNDVKKFIDENKNDLAATGLSDEQIGHAFWLARQHHGSGWLDHSLDKNLEDRLTMATHTFNENDLYVGDDKKIHATGYFDCGGEVAAVEEVRTMAKGGPVTIPNNEANQYSENRIPFKGSNLEGKELDNGDFVVLSYGHYPIWYWCKMDGKWYGNSDKYSKTTAKQITQSRPSFDATILSHTELLAKMNTEDAHFDLGGVMIRTLNPMSVDNTLLAHAGSATPSQNL